MGAEDMRQLMENPVVQIAALCDVDTARMPHDIATVEKKYGKRPDIYAHNLYNHLRTLDRAGCVRVRTNFYSVPVKAG